MIKFEGEVSQKCKSWFVKRELIFVLILTGVFAFVFAAVNVVVALLWDLIALLFLIFPVYMVVFIGIAYKKYVIKRVPSVIKIDDGYIEGENEREEAYCNLDYVKRITDYGEWYIFVFTFPHKIRWFICQKDLIAEGTLEEFEKLFKGKIVRKYKNS